MNPSVVEQLLAVNQRFYSALAQPFARSRAAPQPGFARLSAFWPQPCRRVLDVGCGEGRFGRFLAAHGLNGEYVGVDFSAELLAIARQGLPHGVFHQRDLLDPACLADLGQFDAVACLATLQHIPGADNRQRLMRSLAERLTPTGRLLVSHWQFLASERQRRKVRPWAEIGLTAEAVESHDYLLAWDRGERGLRYVAWIGPEELARLAQAAGCRLLAEFYSDGREGNLNLYGVMGRLAASGSEE